MARLDAGRSLFDHARDAAADLLQSSRPNPASPPAPPTRWTIILADAPPRPLLPEPTANVDALLDRLRAAEPTGRHAALADALRLAGRFLADDHANHNPDPDANPRLLRELHLWTDAQAPALIGIDDTPALPEHTRFAPHTLGRSLPTDNLAIRSLNLAPPRPVVGRPAVLTAVVDNHADAPRRTTLTLTGLADAPARELTIPPRGRAAAAFPLIPDSPSATVLALELPDDAFSLDNRAAVPLIARRPIDVAILADALIADVDEPTDSKSPASDLARAIAPTPSPRFAVRTLDPADLDATGRPPVEAPEILVTFDPPPVDAPSLTPKQRQTLAAWLDAGMGLLHLGRPDALPGLAPISHAPPADNPAADADAARGTSEARDDTDRPGQPLVPIDRGRPPFRVFTGEAMATLLNLTFRPLPADADPASIRLAPDADLLAAWPDGAPALAAASRGRGRVVNLAADLSSPPNRPAPELFRSPAFVPLLHELLNLALPQTPPLRRAAPGASLRQPLPSDGLGRDDAPNGDRSADPVLQAPDGRPIDATIIRGQAGHLDALFTLPQGPESIGLYQWRAPDGRLLAAVAAALDPRESDLTRDTIPTPAPLASRSPLEAALDADRDAPLPALAATRTERRAPTPLWPWCIAAAALLLLAELALAGWLDARPVGGLVDHRARPPRHAAWRSAA